jgi:putative transcriptional regulator
MRRAPKSGARTNQKSTVKDRVLERLQDFTEALQSGERIGEKFTIRHIDLDLQPTSYSPAMVTKVRETLGVSQAVFAKFLGVSLKTVSSWEQGAKPPREIACRFMDEIQAKPEYWKNRLLEIVRIKSTA